MPFNYEYYPISIYCQLIRLRMTLRNQKEKKKEKKNEANFCVNTSLNK